MINKLIAAGCLIALTSAPVFAEEAHKALDATAQKDMVQEFSDVDANKDMKISKEELSAKGRNVAKFKKADINNDGSLNEEEFVAFSKED